MSKTRIGLRGGWYFLDEGYKYEFSLFDQEGMFRQFWEKEYALEFAAAMQKPDAGVVEALERAEALLEGDCPILARKQIQVALTAARREAPVDDINVARTDGGNEPIAPVVAGKTVEEWAALVARTVYSTDERGFEYDGKEAAALIQQAVAAATAQKDAEIARLRSGLELATQNFKKVAEWRKRSQAYDDDMGHERRDFGDEDWGLLESFACRAGYDAEQATQPIPAPEDL